MTPPDLDDLTGLKCPSIYHINCPKDGSGCWIEINLATRDWLVAAARKAERLEAVLLSRYGSQPLALLSELDEAREERDEARRERDELVKAIRAQLLRLGQADAPYLDNAVRDLVDEVLAARDVVRERDERAAALDERRRCESLCRSVADGLRYTHLGMVSGALQCAETIRAIDYHPCGCPRSEPHERCKRGEEPGGLDDRQVAHADQATARASKPALLTGGHPRTGAARRSRAR